MAQTGFTPILIYASGTTTNTPSAGNLTNSANGAELAINYYDGKLFYKDASNVVQVLATKGTGSIGGSNTQVQYNSSGALAGSSNMTFDGTTLTVNGLATTGTVTVGDASGDALTINSSAVSIPNGLNFDSNTFVIDATNNRVGVGTASPSQALDVNISQNAVTRVQIKNTNTGTSAQAGLYVANSDTANYYFSAGVLGTAFTSSGLFVQNSGQVFTGSQIDGLYIHTQKVGSPLVFGTEATEKMRITSTGNVGIGTSSPLAKLVVSNSGAEGLEIITGTSGQIGFQTYNRSSSQYIKQLYSGSQYVWQNSGTDAMTLDSSGNLGLGVTPSAWGSSIYRAVQVGRSTAFWSSTSADIGWFSVNTYFDGTNYKYVSADKASYYQQYQGAHVWATAATGTAGATASFTQAMTLDASGRLGVGVTNPSVGLVVAYGTDGIIGNYYSSSGANSRISFSNSSLLNNNVSIGSATDAMVMYTAATERMRINSSGNVGVGTTNIQEQLTVQNSIQMTNNASNLSGLYFGTNANPALRYSYIQSDARSTGYINFNTNATERMRIDSSGNVGIGTSNPTSPIHVVAASSGVVAQFLGPNAYSAESGIAVSQGRAKISGFLESSGGVPGAYLSFYTTPNGGSLTERLRIDSSGNALFSNAVRATITTDNDLSFDMNAASNFKCTPTAGGALTFTNITSGQTGNIILVNGSNYAITAAATTKVSSTCLATISATGTYWLSYYSDGTNVYVANTGALA